MLLARPRRNAVLYLEVVNDQVRTGREHVVSRVAMSATCLAACLVLAYAPSLGAAGLGGYKFIGSVDTMKLSKDQASSGFTAADAQAVDLAATMPVSHITVDTPLDYPAVMLEWANRIHQDGKKVWFRLSSLHGQGQAHADAPKAVNYQPPYDGYPGYRAGYLTKLHRLMLAHPGLVQAGDIIDGDAEVENSGWWKKNYGCGVQQPCTPCPDITKMTALRYPCAPVSEMNRFLQVMTTLENADLASLGISACQTITSSNCVLTQVHSTDPGTAIHQLSSATVKAMGNLITVDAYPDQNITQPSAAANAWVQDLQSWQSAWSSKGISVTILVGEWGYSNTMPVSDAAQEEVIKAEVKAFPTVSYLAGTNYWVGPGYSGPGGYTNIFVQNQAGVWSFRPAASDISAFYAAMK